ncbi:MAG: F0F1 ATP synthase subunit B' [Rhodospirillales bacterium]|nr:F0F1 ATP synthase subunit B' [Rhodospirillales bacterium]
MRILKTAFTSISALAAIAALGGAPAQAAGLPQLDIATFPPQLIWLAITFVVLYLMMAKVALPRISQVLEERQHKIEDNLKKAENLKEEAEVAAQAYEKALAEARAEAHGIMLETHNRIADEAAKKQAELSRELEAEIQDAEARILEAKNTAMAGLSEVASEVALCAAEKVSGESLSEAEVAKVISAIMEERQ